MITFPYITSTPSRQNEEILKDIKARQHSLTELSKYLTELESQLALIFAASPDIIVFVNSEEKIYKISDAASRILGYTKEEMIGKSLWDFVVEDDIESTQKLHQAVKKDLVCYFDGENTFVNYWKTKTNEKVRLLWRYSICLQNQVIGVATDITHFGRNSFYNLKLLQSIFECTKDGIIILDAVKNDYTIVYVNKAYEKICGYKSQELVGKPCEALITSDILRNSRVIQTLNSCKKAGKSCDVLLQLLKKDGKEIFVHLLMSAVIEQGVITNYIGIIRDVTDLVGIEYDWSPNAERGFTPIAANE